MRLSGHPAKKEGFAHRNLPILLAERLPIPLSILILFLGIYAIQDHQTSVGAGYFLYLHYETLTRKLWDMITDGFWIFIYSLLILLFPMILTFSRHTQPSRRLRQLPIRVAWFSTLLLALFPFPDPVYPIDLLYHSMAFSRTEALSMLLQTGLSLMRVYLPFLLITLTIYCIIYKTVKWGYLVLLCFPLSFSLLSLLAPSLAPLCNALIIYIFLGFLFVLWDSLLQAPNRMPGEGFVSFPVYLGLWLHALSRLIDSMSAYHI